MALRGDARLRGEAAVGYGWLYDLSVRRVGVAALVTCLTILGGAASALASKPVVVSLAVTPRVLASNGGDFTISGRVRRALSCTIFYYDGRLSKHTVKCSSGRFSYRRTAPANPGAEQAQWSVWVEAHSGHQNTKSGEVDVEVLASASALPPVKNLDACSAGSECDYGASYQSFQTWGNTPPDALGDCSFAAAANWEQIVLEVHANPTLIGNEFAQAAGTERGLSQGALWSYWERYGIAGIYLTGLHAYNTTEINVENGVRNYVAMIVEFSFAPGTYFGDYRMAGGLHDAVVDGFTPEGPLVVSWGENIQMTWDQWIHEVVGMWGIGAS